MRLRLKSPRKIKHFTYLSLLTTSLLGPLQVHAAVVTLQNGDQITGELIRLDDSRLTFKSSVFGEITIPWQEVQKLVSDEGARIQMSDGTIHTGKVIVDQSGRLIAGLERSTEEVIFAREDIVGLNPPLDKGPLIYGGQIDLGGSMNRGNATDNQLSIMGTLNATAPKYRYTTGLEIHEASGGGVKTTSSRRLTGQYDSILSKKDYLFVSGMAERNAIADLDLRATIGTGYGRQFIDSDVAKLSGQVGLSYVVENYGTSPDQSFPGLSLGMKFDRDFWNKKLVYFQTHDVDISLRDARDTLVRTRLGVRVPIAKGLNVSGQLSIDYQNRPAPGMAKTDTGLVFSVGYGF